MPSRANACRLTSRPEICGFGANRSPGESRSSTDSSAMPSLTAQSRLSLPRYRRAGGDHHMRGVVGPVACAHPIPAAVLIRFDAGDRHAVTQGWIERGRVVLEMGHDLIPREEALRVVFVVAEPRQAQVPVRRAPRRRRRCPVVPLAVTYPSPLGVRGTRRAHRVVACASSARRAVGPTGPAGPSDARATTTHTGVEWRVVRVDWRDLPVTLGLAVRRVSDDSIRPRTWPDPRAPTSDARHTSWRGPPQTSLHSTAAWRS